MVTVETLNIDPVAEVLALGVYSAYIEGDKSVSIIIIADPEMNKTRSLMRFADIRGVKVQTDLTYYGILNELLPDLKNGKYRTIKENCSTTCFHMIV